MLKVEETEIKSLVQNLYTESEKQEFHRYDGMYYYFQRRNESYENLKNYCMLLGLRINAMMYDGNGQLSKDMFNIQRYCSGVQL